jgi:hypothetical protein
VLAFQRINRPIRIGGGILPASRIRQMERVETWRRAAMSSAT